MILTLDAALAGCLAGVVGPNGVLAERFAAASRGQLAGLPAMVQAALEQAGIIPADLTMIAVTIGPGSFTGIRAALALAHGIGLAAGVPVVGVTVGEALAWPDDGRAHWIAIDSRRGRIFLERGSDVASVALGTLPHPWGPVSLAGDAAGAVASRLAARGVDVLLRPERLPTPSGIAAAARRRTAFGPDTRPAQPLYVDPPEARPSLPT